MAVVDEDVPAGVVHVPVMRFTEQDAIFDAGFTIVDPVSTVMRLASSRGSIAAGESASAVSGDERAADG